MLNQTEEIRLKVLAENESNKILSLVVPKMQGLLKKYVGLKILKVDGCLIKELYQEVEQITNTEKEKIKPYLTPFKVGDFVDIPYFYLYVSPYYFSLRLKICYNGGKYEDKTYYCEYYEKEFSICSLENKQIKDYNAFYELTPFKFIDAEQQIKQIEVIKRLQEQLSNEISKLKPYRLSDMVRR